MGWRDELRGVGLDLEAATCEAMRLTAALLRIAAGRPDETRVDRRTAAKSAAIDRVVEAIDDYLEGTSSGVPSEYLRATIIGGLCDVLDAHMRAEVGVLRTGIVAFETARCLDARFGRTFVDAFRARDGARLRAGDPVPIVAFPAERLTDADRAALLASLHPRTGDPRKRADAIDRTDHLRLAPPSVDVYRVRSTWVDPWLDAVGPATRFGALVTNHAPLHDDFTWAQYSAGSRAVFYDVAPRDLDEQRRRVEVALAEARARKVTIAVLPELCLTRRLFDQVAASGAFAGMPLVVAGSFHEPTIDNAPGENIAAVFAHGQEVFRHRKFSDFYMGDRHEHLDRADGVAGFDLLVGAKCTAVVLICKDAFGEVGDLVQALAPTLLLVPAMSEDTSDFELLATRLAHDPQGFTLVACAGPKVNAVFGRPSRKNSVTSVESSACKCEVFDASGLVK
jgi:hypothetical protein